MLTRLPSCLTHRKGLDFRLNVAGVSAVEFALVLPILLTLIVGSTELAHAIDNWRKVTLLARTVADLTSQGDKQNPISASLMNDILAASTATLQPFKGSDAKIVVSALAVTAAKSSVHPVVCSSAATSNALVRAAGVASDLPLPAGFGQDGARYVLAEVSMSYTPMLGTSLLRLVGTSTINLPVSFVWPTRGGQPYNSTVAEVIMPGGAPCP